MKYSNEVKVGLSIVAAALVFYFGMRYMQDIPLFRGSYVLETRFADASGLSQGNPVRINGVSVGTVEAVTLDPQARRARVTFRVDNSVQIPEGSTASISGVSALGGVRLNITLGAPDNPSIPPGGFVPSPPEEDILAQLSDQAPVLAARTDSLLRSANQTLESAQTLFESPGSDIQTTLASIRGSADAVSQLLREDLEQLNAVIANTETLTGELSALVENNRDSLNATVQNVNRVLSQTERNLVVLERTSTNLDRVIRKIDEGEGTIGRLVNDPSLYVRLDSAATRLNGILDDFQQRPGHYLKDLTLVRVF